MKHKILTIGSFILSGLNFWRYAVDGHLFNLIAGIISAVGALMMSQVLFELSKTKKQNIELEFYPKDFIENLRVNKEEKK
jgi:hypothetical protein